METLARLREALRQAEVMITNQKKEIAILRKENEKYKAALQKIASWKEGAEVNSGFDNPKDAKIARDALK